MIYNRNHNSLSPNSKTNPEQVTTPQRHTSLGHRSKDNKPQMDKYSIKVKLKRKQDQPLSYKLTIFPFKLTILKNMYWSLIYLTAIGYYIEHIVLKISEMP